MSKNKAENKFTVHFRPGVPLRILMTKITRIKDAKNFYVDLDSGDDTNWSAKITCYANWHIEGNLSRDDSSGTVKWIVKMAKGQGVTSDSWQFKKSEAFVFIVTAKTEEGDDEDEKSVDRSDGGNDIDLEAIIDALRNG